MSLRIEIDRNFRADDADQDAYAGQVVRAVEIVTTGIQSLARKTKNGQALVVPCTLGAITVADFLRDVNCGWTGWELREYPDGRVAVIRRDGEDWKNAAYAKS